MHVGPGQRCLFCVKSGFWMRGSQGHVSHAVFPPCATAPRTAHTATAKLQYAAGPGHAKRGATCTYLKACSPPHLSSPTALKQHRDQSKRPVPTSDSDYSDIYQWTVIHIKWQWQWSVNRLHCLVYLACALCITKWSSWS